MQYVLKITHYAAHSGTRQQGCDGGAPYSMFLPIQRRPGRLQFGMGFPGIRVVLEYVAAISEQEMLKDERSSNDL